MLNLLDLLLRDLFIATVPGITTDAQVGFQPPNDDWHTYVSNLGTQLALNVYLIDLREDRKLRMNDRVRTVQNGTVSETAASIKMDCHYLISAWSPAQPAPGVEPTLDEHNLLFQVVATLSGQQFLNPSRVYPAGSPQLNAWPQPYRDREMQMMYLPVEGFRQFAEFWQTMGSDRPWKPAVHAVVTLPVPQPTFVAGGIVTTVLADVVLEDGNGKPELLVTIGGVVQDHSGVAGGQRVGPARDAAGRARRDRQADPDCFDRCAGTVPVRPARPGPVRHSRPGTGPGRSHAEHRGAVADGELPGPIPLGPLAARRSDCCFRRAETFTSGWELTSNADPLPDARSLHQ